MRITGTVFFFIEGNSKKIIYTAALKIFIFVRNIIKIYLHKNNSYSGKIKQFHCLRTTLYSTSGISSFVICFSTTLKKKSQCNVSRDSRFTFIIFIWHAPFDYLSISIRINVKPQKSEFFSILNMMKIIVSCSDVVLATFFVPRHIVYIPNIMTDPFSRVKKSSHIFITYE